MMPPKRKAAFFKKENQLLVTRLMKISLEVDKHVYRNRPISVASARGYIAELIQLSSSRGLDARTKQVIEKLTRQMKSVIAENENTLISMTQDITEISHSSLPNNIYSNDGDGETSPTNNVLAKNINIVNVDDPNIASEEITSIKSDTVTFTNVLQDTEGPTLLESQSILSNTAEDLLNQNKEKTVFKDVQEKVIPKTTKVKPKFLPPTRIKKNQTDLAAVTLCKKANIVFEINSQDILDNETEKFDTHLADKNPQKTKKPKQNNIKPKPKKENKDRNKEAKKVKATVKNEAKKRKYTKNKKQCSPPSITQTENFKTESVLATNNDVNIIKNNSKPIPIQEDLSWIENIKYVREISVDELIPAATSKSFWENLSFAGQINTEDF